MSPSAKPTPSQATLDLISAFEARGWTFMPTHWTGGEGSDTPAQTYWLYKAPGMHTQALTDGVDFTQHELLTAQARFMVRQAYGARLGIEFSRQLSLLIDEMAKVDSSWRHPDGEFTDWVSVPSFVVHLKDHLVQGGSTPATPVIADPTPDPTP